MNTLMEKEASIVGLLRRGSKDNPISRAYLSGVTGIRDRRIREFIEMLRREGHFIVASPKGGYYYGDMEERQTYLAREWNRIKSLVKTLKALDAKVAHRHQKELYGSQ